MDKTNTTEMKIIAHMSTDFPSKFGIPRQSGIIEELKGKIIFETEFRNPDALKGLEDFSHIWVIWNFSETQREGWAPTVRPPALGGNTRVGVFATRSPFRPNPIAMSCIKIESIDLHTPEGPVIEVSGVDMMDGTPIFDIKPYVPYADCRPEAASGFASPFPAHDLELDFPESELVKVPEKLRSPLIRILKNDPRPAYHADSEREYGLPLGSIEVRFFVDENVIHVISVTEA